MNLRSILCPVDFSDQSRQALLWASRIAGYRGAELTVLSVVEPLLAHAAGARLGDAVARADAEAALRSFVGPTVPGGVELPPHIRIEVATGNPAEVILRAALRLHAGLIVMGTHGLAGFRKLLLGSTTEEVLRRTDRPVLAVPPGAAAAAAMAHPGVELRRILVATDLRDGATAAVQWAGELASAAGLPVTIAHVVEPVVVSPLWEPLVADLDSGQVAAAQRALDGLSSTFHDAHVDRVVSAGSPAETIASLAVDHRAGLVVLGLADPQDPGQRRPGSIAYHVLRTTHVPVVVVPRAAAPAAVGPGPVSQPTR